MLKEVMIKSERADLAEGVLYLTDDLKLLKELQKRGEKAAAILTQENRSQDFSRTPYAVEQVEELEPEDFEKLYRRLAGLPLYVLETDRCRLREMTAADVDRLYEIYRDEAAAKYMEDLPEGREEGRIYVKDYYRYAYGFYGYGIWMIEEKASGEIIGRAGVEQKEQGIELGYVIAEPWRGKGYAREACEAALEYAWREIGCASVTARTWHDNRPSVRLLEKLGFCKQGEDDKGMEKYIIYSGQNPM